VRPLLALHSHSLFAVVVQDARRRRSRNARDCAQVFVDSTEVMVGHVVIDGPWHYLEKISIERGRQTSSVGGTGTGWMEVIHVDACPYDLNKLVKCVTPFRKPSFVRGQIARDDMWKGPGPGKGPKSLPPPK